MRNAVAILQSYDGRVPLAAFLKHFFAQHKKFGSRDRKQIGALCHQYFRLGHFADFWSLEDRILLADWLCHEDTGPVAAALWPERTASLQGTVTDKCAAVGLPFKPEKHTPWFRLLQTETAIPLYVASFFTQPALYLRVRPGHKQAVEKKLATSGWEYLWKADNTVALPNAQLNIEPLLEVNKEVIVQDWSSQLCGEMIAKHDAGLQGVLWDCCSASGGKTLMMADLYGKKLRFLVSDVRASILHNLQKRFAEANFQNYTLFEANLENPTTNPALKNGVDIVLADVPCTGSGTWSRTPERHYYFEEKDALTYVEKQRVIVANALKHLKQGGALLYITCSVFACENEEQLVFFEKQHGLEIKYHQSIDGTQNQADSMFLAILKKP